MIIIALYSANILTKEVDCYRKKCQKSSLLYILFKIIEIHEHMIRWASIRYDFSIFTNFYKLEINTSKLSIEKEKTQCTCNYNFVSINFCWIQILSLNSNKILQKDTKKNAIKLFSFNLLQINLKLKFHNSHKPSQILFSKIPKCIPINQYIE